MRIVVLGYIVRGPLGGLVWHHLQYVLGLAELGHDVLFLEESDDYPSCYDPVRDVTDEDPAYGLKFIEQTFSKVGLRDKWAYYDALRGLWHGPAGRSALSFCASADLVLNVSGMNPLRPWLAEIPVRALIDTDPGFTQIRHITDRRALDRARGHTAFLTYGENFGKRACSIPDDGLPWQGTRQPIVLRAWPVTCGPETGRWTTVMQWESYPAPIFQGRRYGMKSDSFSDYLDMPSTTGTACFELAIGGATAPIDLLRAHGWTTVDSRAPTESPWTYQQFIQRSKAEFAVAKQGYVMTRSGWFSERSAAYLASGRPVVTQNTGFSDLLPTGAGLFAYQDVAGAQDAIERVNDRYDYHCRSAREMACAWFDSRPVLAALLERVGCR